MTRSWLVGVASLLAFLGVLLGGAPGRATRVPDTIDLVVLSKHRPAAVRVDGGCRRAGTKSGAEIRSLAVEGGLVRACDVKGRCTKAPRVQLRCREDARLVVDGLEERRYGRALSARVQAGSLRLIARVDLEGYVGGVVAAELGATPAAAQEAQAILARTYAVHALSHPRHDDAPLCDLTHCQAFAGKPASGRGEEAALRTRSRLLVDERGVPATVFYHSTCGGRTIAGDVAWPGLDAPYLEPVSDLDDEGHPWCKKSPHIGWGSEANEAEVAAALARLAGRPLDAPTLSLKPLDDEGARFRLGDKDGAIEVAGTSLHGALGQALGWGRVKSTRFSLFRAGPWLRFSGTGLGHRVGLCQHGAMARARAGQRADEILRAYFPRLTVTPKQERR